MRVFPLSPGLSFINVAPAVAGFEEFLSCFVWHKRKIALSDVGPTTAIDNLVSGLRELGLNPADVDYIFTSHVHQDHAGGVGRALQQMPRARVIVHERGTRHLVDPQQLEEASRLALGELVSFYGAMEPVPEDRIIIGRDGLVFDLGDAEMEVLETPGHATHNLSFWERRDKVLFAGDTAGVYLREIDLVRPTTPFPFHLEQALNSLDRLIGLAPSRLCYAHYGCAAPAEEKLRLAKQQLILWGTTILDCLESGVSPDDMLTRVFERDTAMSRLEQLTPAGREREMFFLRNCIPGFIGYFDKFGPEYLRQLRHEEEP